MKSTSLRKQAPQWCFPQGKSSHLSNWLVFRTSCEDNMSHLTCSPISCRHNLGPAFNLKRSPNLGQPALEPSRVRPLVGGGADEPFNSDTGALLATRANAECG